MRLKCDILRTASIWVEGHVFLFTLFGKANQSFMVSSMLQSPTVRLRRRTALLMFAAVSALSACTSLPSGDLSPEEAVRARAQAKWNAQLAGQWQTVYDFSAPSYRAVVDLDKFRARFGSAVRWLAAEVVSVTCQDEVCTASVRIESRPALAASKTAPLSTHVDEKWVREEGQWWVHQKL